VTKEIIIEKPVITKKYVDVPYETIIEVPQEIFRDVEVKVPVYTEKHVDRTIIRPIETQIVNIEVPVHREVIVDKVVTRQRPVEVPIYVD